MKYNFALLSPLGLALAAFLNLNLSTSPSLVSAAALPVAQTVAVQPGHEANQQPKIWPDTPVCATAGLENGLNDLDATDLNCSGRDLPKDPPWDMDTLKEDWPCLCKARGGKGAAIKSAGITFFFFYCGPAVTFDVVFPAIEKFCEQFDWI